MLDLTAAELDKVLLVGGSTRMLSAQDKVKAADRQGAV